MKSVASVGAEGAEQKGAVLFSLRNNQHTIHCMHCTKNYQATITIRYHIAEAPYYDNVHCIRLARLRLCWLALGHCHLHL